MILCYETDALPQFVKEAHDAVVTGLGTDTKTSDTIAVRKFVVTDDDRCNYEDLAEAECVFLVYVKKGGK